MPSDDLAAFAEELAAFGSRIEELRAAQALPADQLRPAFEAAVLEFDQAVQRLWQLHRSLADRTGRNAGHSRREAQLLRTVFQEFPLPVLLLDRDAVVERLNAAAAELIGAGPGYATGRSLTGIVAPPHRAAFRSHVSAVARTGEARSVIVGSAADPQAGFQVTLVALKPPGQPRNTVLALVQATGRAGRRPGPQRAREAAGPPGREAEEARRGAVHLDLMDAMTTALLGAGGEDAHTVLRRAAAVLRDNAADWVIGDLLDESGLRRCAVLGPPGHNAEEMAASLLKQHPEDCPLVVSALDSPGPVVELHPEDVEGFGHDQEGTAVLARARVTSLVCLPLCSAAPAGRARPVRGVVTLFRTEGREPFGLAEVAVLDRMSRHLALGLERGRSGFGA